MTSNSSSENVSKIVTITPTSVSTIFDFYESDYLTNGVTYTYNRYVAYAELSINGVAQATMFFKSNYNKFK